LQISMLATNTSRWSPDVVLFRPPQLLRLLLVAPYARYTLPVFTARKHG